MHFKFDITLTDKDYLDCNVFLMLKSPYGKGQLIKFRILFAVLVLAVAILSLIGGDFSTMAFISLIPYTIVLIIFEVFARPFFVWTIKGQIKAMKKQDKLAFSPFSVLEFSDDSLIETTPENKTELKYSALERISVVEGGTVYLHVNSLMIYILPRDAFASDVQYEDFLAFIRTKCTNIDAY